MNYQTALAKVKGLGSAKSGTEHFWMQRITAITLIPLSFWMVAFTQQLLQSSHQEIVAWLSEPLNTLFAVCWIIAAFYHSALGLQVIVEDYIPTEWLKITLVWSIKLFFLFAGIAGVITVFKISVLG